MHSKKFKFTPLNRGNVLDVAHEVLIVKVTLANGAQVSKKIIF